MAKRNRTEHSNGTEGMSRARIATFPLHSGFSSRVRSLTPTDINNYIAELKDWVLKPTSIHFVAFWTEKGISRMTWYDWMDKYPALKDAYLVAKDIIGQRREHMAIFNRESKANPETIHKSLRYYDYVWKELYDEDVANKVQTLGTTTKEIQVVEMESFTTRTPEEVAAKAKEMTRKGSGIDGKAQSQLDHAL